MPESVGAGGTAAFWVLARGTPRFSYQWNFNGGAIAGATNAVLVITDAQAANAGSYTVTVSNAGGSLTSGTAPLTVNAAGSGAPIGIFLQPRSQNVAGGSTVVFTTATGTGGGGPTDIKGSRAVTTQTDASLTYQWFLDGIPILGATGQTLVISGATAADDGGYTCIATDSTGSALSSTAMLEVVATANPGRLINLSSRALVGTGASQLIVGYVVGGAGTSGEEPLLVRASGPALAQFGVSGALADPTLTLNGAGVVLATNSGWSGNAQITSTANAVGAFEWTSATSHDSALLESLAAGPYTVQVTGASGDSGISLAEVYDATSPSGYTAASPRLINVSARDQVGTGGNILIAGFVIGGTTSKTVLIRASGPALAAFGVPGVLMDPELQLYSSNPDGTSTLLESDTGWGGDPTVSTAAASVGAFSWGTSATPDSALLVTLAPGAYTAEVSGASGDTGIALVEVYDVP